MQIKALKAAAPRPAVQKPAPTAGIKRPREEGETADVAGALPAGFFDASAPQEMAQHGAAQLSETTAPSKAAAESHPAAGVGAQPSIASERSADGGGSVSVGLELAYGSSDEDEESEEEPAAIDTVKQPETAAGSNSLPEGFFDDKAKDALAHNKPAPKKLDIDEVRVEVCWPSVALNPLQDSEE